MGENNSESTKRIVLVGHPGSGKTMLAIGLFNSQRKGAKISVSDPEACKWLSDVIANTVGKDNNKKWPPPAFIIDEKDAGKTERKAYPFKMAWRGEMFSFEFEDYAGERTSNPENLKTFIASIIGNEPYGAILLLNPGMELFKPQKELEVSHGPVDVESILSNRAALPNSYETLVDALCEKGCKHFVLAVTASDRISRGGDLYQTEQHKHFKAAFKKIKGYLKKRLSSENKKIKKDKRTKGVNKLDYTSMYVTVTGRLKYDEEGNAQEVHLAKGSENKAADPFLWIIDPWRMRFRELVKRLMRIMTFSLLLLTAIYVGAHAWNGYKIKNWLNLAEDSLAKFGDSEAVNFNNENGAESLAVAEDCLKEANEREWFVADKDMHAIDERLPTLLATLMTNQVRLAYKNSKVDQSDWHDPHMALEGQTELESSWKYWARSTRGKVSYEAAKLFLDHMTKSLSSNVLNSNVQYLIREFGRMNDYGKQKDEVCKFLFEKAHSCLNDVVVAGNTNDFDNLKSLRDICLGKWMKDVSDGISKNGAEGADERISIVITMNTGLDRAVVRKRIFASHRDVELRDFKEKAAKCEKKVLVGDYNLYAAAAELFSYLSENAGSPYKWIVLGAFQRKCNEAVSAILSKEDNREDLFDDMFRATRKLRTLDEKKFNEEYFGDNALYWLAATITNESGAVYQYSTEWLRYDFKCDAVAVRTDHATNNPDSPVFKREVDANMALSWQGEKRKIGGDWLIKNEDGENEWTMIPDSHVSCRMAATDILEIDVGQGREDWKWNKEIPAFMCKFRPGWNDNKRYFAYESKQDVYPKDALYWVMLYNVHMKDEPCHVFSKALKMAQERADALKAKRDEKVKAADAELERYTKEKGGVRHE